MRRGLTLLELLLAFAVFIVLLGIVWNAMSFVLRTETTRAQQTGQQQVVRTWMQIIDDDFRSAIQDTEQLDKAEGSGDVRHFGLVGTATQLRIDISDYSWRSAEASELRTIFYEFQQAGGLVRREQDYTAPQSAVGKIQNAPEIIGGQFRYFDGGTWHEHWASIDRKRAPSAIEVTLYSLPPAEAERWRRQIPITREPMPSRRVIHIPAASQMYFESYSRAQPPRPPEESPPPPSFPAQPAPPPPPPPSPFHSLFGDN